MSSYLTFFLKNNIEQDELIQANNANITSFF